MIETITTATAMLAAACIATSTGSAALALTLKELKKTRNQTQIPIYMDLPKGRGLP
jgi:predicted protein tyrosine phosphatase